jgi:ParB/RepB/Spo0J family partition protein
MLVFVPLNHIDDNPYQRRAEYGDIEELAERIHAAKSSYPETLGLMQVPRGRVVVVDTDTIVGSDSVKRFVGKDGRWNEDPKTFRVQLAFGHRRKRAFEYLNRFGEKYDGDYYYMPIHIDPLTDKQMLDAVWAENYERKDISAVEQAELIQLKLQQLGPDATHATIGNEWGLSRPVISNRLGLLELPDSVKQANRDGRVSERLALALKPVLRIGELTKGSGVSWGSKVGEQWGPPASPEKYVEYAIANPDKVTSDDVREFAKRLTRHAGEQLPSWLGKEKIDGRGVEQPQCKGCPFRIDQSCLKPSCMKAKLQLWPDIALEAFSRTSGIPVSDREADLEPFADSHLLRHRLRELYAAGETGGGMVCAWRVGRGGHVRPYGEKSGDYVYNVANETDGRCGIALGYRGTLPATEVGGNQSGEPVYEMPEAELILEWNTEALKIQKAAHKTMTAALTNALLHQVAEFDVLQALIFPVDAEWIDDVSKLAKHVAEFLIDRGRGVGYAYSPYDLTEIYQTTVKRAGLQIDVLGSASEVVEKIAVVILQGWYGNNNYTGYGWEKNANRTALRIAEWEQQPGAAASPMAEHIARAKRHIEEKIAAEGEAAKNAERERLEKETAVADDTAVCGHCGDALEITDGTTCSCGAVVCEDCYVEENHVFHDTDRDPFFDDLVAKFPELVKEETAVPIPTTDTPAVAWLRSYVDDTGRTWRELEPNQTHHANSPCFQAFTRAFPDEAEPKWQLKQARAVLEQEAAVMQEVSA